ncbi:unnamed protein product [Closterium sp. Naga37s-1]|nr:unnamed protein product [Closterium sp. Naga37s-1]
MPGLALDKAMVSKSAKDEVSVKSKFMRRLAASDEETRDQAFEVLSRWLIARKEIAEEDLLKIWKGLFYCMWHSDKPPVQANLAERMSGILISLDPDLALLFLRTFWKTMRREWGGIDYHRLDKFYMLVRLVMRNILEFLEKREWEEEVVSDLAACVMQQGLLAKDKFRAIGLELHILDIFNELFKKSGGGDVRVVKAVLQFTRPVVGVIQTKEDGRLHKRALSSVFSGLAEYLRNEAKANSSNASYVAALQEAAAEMSADIKAAHGTAKGKKKSMLRKGQAIFTALINDLSGSGPAEGGENGEEEDGDDDMQGLDEDGAAGGKDDAGDGEGEEMEEGEEEEGEAGGQGSGEGSGEEEDGEEEDGKAEDGEAEDGEAEDGEAEDGEAEDGEAQDAEAEAEQQNGAKVEDDCGEHGEERADKPSGSVSNGVVAGSADASGEKQPNSASKRKRRQQKEQQKQQQQQPQQQPQEGSGSGKKRKGKKDAVTKEAETTPLTSVGIEIAEKKGQQTVQGQAAAADGDASAEATTASGPAPTGSTASLRSGLVHPHLAINAKTEGPGGGGAADEEEADGFRTPEKDIIDAFSSFDFPQDLATGAGSVGARIMAAGEAAAAAVAGSEAGGPVTRSKDGRTDAAAVGVQSAPAGKAGGAGKRKKKVIFVLSRNLEMAKGGPVPPPAVRTPPASQPKGSALKPGTKPGPINMRMLMATADTSPSQMTASGRKKMDKAARSPAKSPSAVSLRLANFLQSIACHPPHPSVDRCSRMSLLFFLIARPSSSLHSPSSSPPSQPLLSCNCYRLVTALLPPPHPRHAHSQHFSHPSLADSSPPPPTLSLFPSTTLSFVFPHAKHLHCIPSWCVSAAPFHPPLENTTCLHSPALCLASTLSAVEQAGTSPT